MDNKSQNNKRIAKNTLALYIRTFITLSIGLFTSRVVLNALGVNDYGIYNVVGGIVAMFSIVTSSLSQAISRYLTFELGKDLKDRLHKIFCTSVNIQILMSVIIVLLAEVIGVWFLNYKMNIPSDRMYAANWVMQFSILSFVINLISIPYNAVIIAHERMKVFAYISIFEAVMKLVIVACLYISSIDKLITYSFLLLFVAVVIRIIYGVYCKRNFEECHYSLIFDKTLFKDMSKFAGWNFTGVLAYILNTQGINIISNLFFGVTVNAARGIATQVEGIVKNFVNNFTTAVRPQIIKSYSSGDMDYMTKLVCSSTKYSYFLMWLFALPIIIETETILKLWLHLVPEHTVIFLRLTMTATLMSLLGEMMFTNVMAIGKLKNYMIYESIITCLVFPLSYLLFLKGFPAETSYILFSTAYFVLIFVRLWYLKREENFPVQLFVKTTLLPVIATTLFSLLIPLLVSNAVHVSSDILSFIINVPVCVISCIFSIVIFGLQNDERKFVVGKLSAIIHKNK